MNSGIPYLLVIEDPEFQNIPNRNKWVANNRYRYEKVMLKSVPIPIGFERDIRLWGKRTEELESITRLFWNRLEVLISCHEFSRKMFLSSLWPWGNGLRDMWIPNNSGPYSSLTVWIRNQNLND